MEPLLDRVHTTRPLDFAPHHHPTSHSVTPKASQNHPEPSCNSSHLSRSLSTIKTLSGLLLLDSTLSVFSWPSATASPDSSKNDPSSLMYSPAALTCCSPLHRLIRLQSIT